LSKSAFLDENFSHYGDRFELVVVMDITKDGAFDEAVKGVDAIAHTASPFYYNSTNPDDVRSSLDSQPLLTIKTCLDFIILLCRVPILKSALKHENTLKRLILTSSAVGAIELTTVLRFFTESDWNDAAVEAVKTKHLLCLKDAGRESRVGFCRRA